MPIMSTKLTQNALQMFLVGERTAGEPILQILDIKPMEDPKGFRCRLTVSDGVHSYNKLTTSHQSAENSRILDVFDIIKFTNYTLSELPGRGYVTILVDWDVIENAGERIGDPVPVTKQPAAAAAAPAAPQQNAAQTRPFAGARPGFNDDGVRQRGGVVQQENANPSAHTLAAGYHPIVSVTPYQNKWKILAKCTSKSDVKRFNKRDNTEGQLFNVELADKTGEIRATAFGPESEKFFPIFQTGGTFAIENGRVQQANKQYTSLKNDYEIVFSKDTKVEPVFDANAMGTEHEEKHWSFVKFKDLHAHLNKTIDIIGIVKDLAEMSSVIGRKSQMPIDKRDMTMVDDTGTAVNVTMWSEKAKEFSLDGDQHPVVAIRGVTVKDFGGISLSTGFNSKVKMNPDIKAAHDLKGWYIHTGYLQEATSLTQARGAAGGGAQQLKLIDVADKQNMGRGAKPDYFDVKGTVHFIKSESCMYPSCSLTLADGKLCRKKLIDQGNGNYKCEKCQKELPSFKISILLSIEIADFTGMKWITLFTEQAEQLLGVNADDLNNLKTSSEEQYNRVFQDVMFKTFLFRIGAREDSYNEQTRVRWNCYNIKPIDWSVYQKYLDEQIEKMEKL